MREREREREIEREEREKERTREFVRLSICVLYVQHDTDTCTDHSDGKNHDWSMFASTPACVNASRSVGMHGTFVSGQGMEVFG